jgi:hypothetical protein
MQLSNVRFGQVATGEDLHKIKKGACQIAFPSLARRSYWSDEHIKSFEPNDELCFVQTATEPKPTFLYKADFLNDTDKIREHIKKTKAQDKKFSLYLLLKSASDRAASIWRKQLDETKGNTLTGGPPQWLLSDLISKITYKGYAPVQDNENEFVLRYELTPKPTIESEEPSKEKAKL